MYEKELMTAILTASTTLVGLTAVVIAQIEKSGNDGQRTRRLKMPFIASVVFGLVGIMFDIWWFASPSGSLMLSSVCLFGFQIILFSGNAVTFWLRGV